MNKKLTPEEVLETKGRWPIFVKFCMILIVFSAVGELIGTLKVPIGPGNLIIMPMVWAMVLVVLITPDALGRKIEALKKNLR